MESTEQKHADRIISNAVNSIRDYNKSLEKNLKTLKAANKARENFASKISTLNQRLLKIQSKYFPNINI